jgi:hypothetical protein
MRRVFTRLKLALLFPAAVLFGQGCIGLTELQGAAVDASNSFWLSTVRQVVTAILDENVNPPV